MVKVAIQEKCPHCKKIFDSLIEFDHNQGTKNGEKNHSNSQSNFVKPFSGNFTLGKFMQVVSLIGDTSYKMGNQSVGIIVEQCKLMGLKKEDENIIYRIVEMIGKQDVSLRDVLITTYRFAKVLGINDDVADMYYYKLMINTKTDHIPDNSNIENIKDIMWEGN